MSERPGVGLRVCVFCSSSAAIDPAYLALAERVGRELAQRGWTLVSGGGSVSMMGAVARGARAAGGHTVGVIPEALLALEVTDHDAAELVVTPDLRTRKAEMDARADAFLALPGGIGTLDELVEAWTSLVLGLHAKPVVVLDPDGLYAGLRAQLATMLERGFVRSQVLELVTWVADAAAALDACAAARTATAPVGSPTTAEMLEGEPGAS